MSYLDDEIIEVQQRAWRVRLRVLSCQFCQTKTPPPTVKEQGYIDLRRIATTMGGLPFVTPMEHYRPEGWRILTADAYPLSNFDRFAASLVCPACAARMHLPAAPSDLPPGARREGDRLLRKTITLTTNHLNNQIYISCPGEPFDRCTVQACTPGMHQKRRGGQPTTGEETRDWHQLREGVTTDLRALFERMGFVVIVGELT